MMSESQALETLSREDPEAAGDARAALAWLTGDEGLETISLLRLQEFLWYALPVKWPMSTPGRVGVAKALGRLFLLAGLVNLGGSPVVRAAYRAWDYPANFYRVVGIIELTVALFLALPETRIWGVILGGFIAFFSVVTLLKNRRYAWSLPVMLLLAALVPVSFAHG